MKIVDTSRCVVGRPLKDFKHGDVIRIVGFTSRICVVGYGVRIGRRQVTDLEGGEVLCLSSDKLVEPISGHFVITNEEATTSE